MNRIKICVALLLAGFLSACATPKPVHCTDIDDQLRPVNKGMVELHEQQ